MAILERHIPFLLEKTYWIPIGSNILVCPELNVEKTPSLPIVTYFGMIYPNKGVEMILDVLEAVMRKGLRFTFKFIGGGIIYHSSYHTDFLSKLHKRRLVGVVDYLGLLPAEDVSRWLLASRFVFLPFDRGLSDRRGSFMAALAHGKPILTAPPVVPMPFIKNGIHALWPEEPTVSSYAELFIKLLTDDELHSRLEQGASRLSPNFTWERIASELDQVLRK
jgi:glycosyltransferase involved in cell wall biosynthesis